MNDLISIIVPVYNSERVMRETIDSIINQTYTNIEILLIDDGSTDHSPNICDSYQKDARVRVFHRENAGLSATRQFGIDQARGKYYVTIDADDFMESSFVEKMYNAIQKSGAHVAVCGRYRFLDGSKAYVRENLNLGYDTITITPDLLREKYRKIGAGLWLSESWNKMYEIQFVRDSSVRFELGRKYNGNDFAFNYKLVLHCPTYCIVDEPLLYYRVMEGSMVHRKNKPLQEGFETIVEQIIQESRMVGLDMEGQIRDVYYSLLYLVALNIFKYSDGYRDRCERIDEYITRHRAFISRYEYLVEKMKTDEGMLKRIVIRLTRACNAKGLVLLSTLFLLVRGIRAQIKHLNGEKQG